MQLKTKKKIAREVLLLLSSGIITLIIFLLVYPFNWYCNYKSESIQTLISFKTVESDSLVKNYNSKLKQQQWFYEESIKDLKMEYNSSSELWQRLEEIYNVDSIVYKYNNTWGKNQITLLNKLGFGNGKDFKEFIAKNSLTETDKANKLKSTEIKNEILKLKFEKRSWEFKVKSTDEQMEVAIKGLLIVLFFLYPIRLLYWLIVWSFNTLKQKGE